MKTTDKTYSLARISLYLGLLSIIITPIPALLCGHIALYRIKKLCLSGKKQAFIGLSLGYLFLLFYLFLFILPLLGALSFFILSDKPDFNEMNWTEIRVRYWVKKATEVNYRKNKRFFLIQDKKVIEQLKNKMDIKNIKTSSLGADDQIVITIENGNKWQGSLIFEDRISLSLQSRMSDSYYVYLHSYNFYRELLDLAFLNEQQIDPNIQKREIILRRNKY